MSIILQFNYRAKWCGAPMSKTCSAVATTKSVKPVLGVAKMRRFGYVTHSANVSTDAATTVLPYERTYTCASHKQNLNCHSVHARLRTNSAMCSRLDGETDSCFDACHLRNIPNATYWKSNTAKRLSKPVTAVSQTETLDSARCLARQNPYPLGPTVRTTHT